MDQFLAEVLPRQIEAEKAICNGDPGPRLAMWSSKNPMTLFGADATKQSAEEVRRFFRLVASWRGGERAPLRGSRARERRHADGRLGLAPR